MHTVQLERQNRFETLHIIVIENLFSHGIRIDEKFDLKGSVYKRTATPEEIASGAPKKDLDFRNENKRIMISCHDYDRIVTILNEDVNFLVENHIIDYSLLVGIHDRMKDIKPIYDSDVKNKPINRNQREFSTPERSTRKKSSEKDLDIEKTVKKSKPQYLKKQDSPLSTQRGFLE